MTSILEALSQYLTEHCDVDAETIKPEASFTDDLGLDSLDLVELVMHMEETFGTKVSDEEAEKLVTVGDAVRFIEERRK